MSVIATEGRYARFGSLVKVSDTPENFTFHTQLVTANEAAPTTYTLGTVLGKVTATGKYVKSVRTAVDGSQTPATIYLADSFGLVKDTSLQAGVDAKVLVLARGKVIVSMEALQLDASFGNTSQKQSAYDALNAVGILVEPSF